MEKVSLSFLTFLYPRVPRLIQKGVLDKWIIRHDEDVYFSKIMRALYYNIYNIQIGIGSYGCFDVLQFPPGTQIGNYCSIAPRVHFLFSNHPMDGASTHPIFYNKKLGFVPEDRIERVRLTVDNDVWIGADTVITRGCQHIGNGAVIGAGSVVTHDVEKYAIMAGNPARLLRYRFDGHIQELLERSRWYELGPDDLAQFIDDAASPIIFAQKVTHYRKEKNIL